MVIQVCVGSSCYLKGSPQIVSMLQQAIADAGLEAKVELAGCFCIGRCNREGVSGVVDGQVFTGITPQNFDGFFARQVLGERGE